jgi:hypothetical protein
MAAHVLCASHIPCALFQPDSSQWRRWRSMSACACWRATTIRYRSSCCCTALAATWLVMRYRLAASSASCSTTSFSAPSPPHHAVLAKGQQLHSAELVGRLPLPLTATAPLPVQPLRTPRCPLKLVSCTRLCRSGDRAQPPGSACCWVGS